MMHGWNGRSHMSSSWGSDGIGEASYDVAVEWDRCHMMQ